jgi:DNA polymerase sigma
MDYKLLEKHFADYILNLLGPNEELDSNREKKFNVLRGIVIGSFIQEIGIIPHVFCFGSFPLKTYLQESDLDITIILEDKIKGTMLSNYSYDYLNK